MLARPARLRAGRMHPIVCDMNKVVILDNIRSAHNVGSVFRTSDGAGVEKVYLVGTTPTPIDRFGREQPEIKKTSLGASESIVWEHIGGADRLSTMEAIACIAELKNEGYQIVAVEQTKNSVDLSDFKVPDKVAYIFGAEVDGVQPALLEVSDKVVEIPMAGIKESLNVSVTAGIILFH